MANLMCRQEMSLKILIYKFVKIQTGTSPINPPIHIDYSC